MRMLTTRLAALRTCGVRGVKVLSFLPALGAVLTAGVLSVGLGSGQAEAKTPGKTYCYNRVCHRVKTLAETRALVGGVETLHTSHYDSCKKDRFNPCGLTSSGEVFRADTPDNAASPIYPNGTVLLIWSPATKKSAVVRVNNAGPYWKGRKLDVSRATAQKLGFAGRGVAHLKVRVLSAPTRAEATYKRNRRYEAVPGYIGAFASLDEAHIGVAQTYAVAALSLPAGGASATAVAALAPAQADRETVSAESAAPELAAEQAAVVSAAASAAAVGASSEVASAVTTPSTEVAAVEVSAPAANPIQVATLIDTTDVTDGEAQRPPNSARNMTGERRVRAEANQPRNSRAYRAKARQQAASRQRTKTVTRERQVAATDVPRVPRAPKGARPITSDPTNDMSVFSRHTTTGASRLAARDMGRRDLY